MMTSRRVKKAVMRKAELIVVLVPIHGLLTLLTDVNGLLDPSARSGKSLLPSSSRSDGSLE